MPLAAATSSGGALLRDLTPLLAPERVVILPPGTAKAEALRRLIAVTAAAFFREADRAYFAKAIFEREELTTTAVGGGIAIPHARLPTLPGCVLSVGLAPGGIDFGARDGLPVRIILMIAARDCDKSEHLRVLASAAGLLHDPDRRTRILGATTPAAVIAALLSEPAPPPPPRGSGSAASR